MNAIVITESSFNLLDSVMRFDGVFFPYPLKVVFEGGSVYMKYENSARLSDASATLSELAIHHRCSIL